jgi:DNA polymerase/3'-5' exonuclease PolX
MQYEDAKIMLDDIVKAIERYCHRIAIAGDVRRRIPECKQFDIVIIPDVDKAIELYGMLSELAGTKIDIVNKYFIIPRVIDGKAGIHPVHVSITNPMEWACKMIERTGSPSYYREITARSIKAGYAFRFNRLWKLQYPTVNPAHVKLESVVTAHDENDIFRILGLSYTEPQDREWNN